MTLHQITREVSQKPRRNTQLVGAKHSATKCVEKIETIYAKAGSAIESEIYSFDDKGGRRLGLRFDLTVGIARMVASNPDWPKPLRIAAISNVWRYDEPQYGRYRSLVQWDVELFGTESAAADAEIVQVSAAAMNALGFTDHTLLVGDRGLLDAFLDHLKITAKRAEIMRIMDKRGKISPEEMARQLEEIPLSGTEVDAIFDLAGTRGGIFEVCDELHKRPGLSDCPCIDRMRRIGELLEGTIGLDGITFDLSLVRGLDYYTGFVFECFDPDDLALGSVFGGGRFDRLVGIYGRDCPAVGCAGGVSRLIMALESKGLIPGEVLKVPVAYVAPVTEAEMPDAMRIGSQLRREGIPTVVEVMGRKLRRSLDAANRGGNPFVVIVGRRDLDKGKVTVKEMETGEERSVDIPGIAASIRKRSPSA